MTNKKSTFNYLILFTGVVCLFIGITIGHFISKHKGFTAKHWFNQQEARKQDYGNLLGKQRIQESQIKLFKECVSKSDENTSVPNAPISKKQLDNCLAILQIE